jgi:hypothetical protein
MDHYGNKWDTFLNRIITGDETWIYHFKQESKWQSMECKRPQLPSKKSSDACDPQEN